MPRGGKRKGTGRPKISGENREPTKTVRVPLSFAEKIPELLKKHQEENSLEDLRLPAKAQEECLPLASLASTRAGKPLTNLSALITTPMTILSLISRPHESSP